MDFAKWLNLYVRNDPVNWVDPYGLMSVGDAFAKFEMALEPYVIGGGMVVGGAIVTGAGAVATVSGYGSMPVTGPVGAITGTAGVLTTVAGAALFTTGIDIYADQLRHELGLPAWFDVISAFDFFPPHGEHDVPCNR